MAIVMPFLRQPDISSAVRSTVGRLRFVHSLSCPEHFCSGGPPYLALQDFEAMLCE